MNKYSYGLIFGKFAPLTQGHINFINNASLQCDTLYVFLSYDQKFVDAQKERDKKILNLRNRLLWLKQTYKDIPHIKIDFVDETSLPAYPNGWKAYSDLIIEKMPKSLKGLGAVFTSEPEYDSELKTYFPKLNHEIIDFERTQVPISATKIRNNIYKHWEMIPSIVRKEYTLKVCVIGTESSGKTTLVKYLAKLFNTSWVEEYGRKYCEDFLCGDETLLIENDYLHIAYNHKVEEEKSFASSNKISFIDSNAFITEFYHRLYQGKKSLVLSEIAKSEHYDLIIYMSDDVKWVDDGLRVNQNNRNETTKLFNDMLEEFPNQKKNLVYINAKTYKERFDLARNEVEKLLKRFECGSI